ncbi:hypothetical protein YC2023_049947 [Brassica napus]
MELRKAKPEGEQLFLVDDKLRSEAPMFKLTKPSILADRLLPVVVRRLKHRGIWGRKRKRENKGYLPNMKTSKRMSMALYINIVILQEASVTGQLLPIRNDPVHHAEKYPTPPAVYSGKHGSVSILNLYSSTLPSLTRYLHLLDEQVLPIISRAKHGHVQYETGKIVKIPSNAPHDFKLKHYIVPGESSGWLRH